MDKYQKNDVFSYCLGMSLTIEALKERSRYLKKVVLSQKAARNEQLSYLLELCAEKKVPYEYDEHLISKLSAKENCYCIGIFEKYSDELAGNDHIILSGFHDFNDLGTVLRSAVSFDMKDIVLLGEDDLDYFDPRLIRASMGSFFHCHIVRYPDLMAYRKDHPDNQLYVFADQGDHELQDLQLKEPYSLLISAEEDCMNRYTENTYYIKHKAEAKISLSIRTAIIFSQIFYLKRSR